MRLQCFTWCNYFNVPKSRRNIWSPLQWRHNEHDSVLKSPAIAIVYSTVYSDADQRKHQSSASLAFVRGIHRGPVNSPHKWPVTRKLFPFDDVIMLFGLISVSNRDTIEYGWHVKSANVIKCRECGVILFWYTEKNTFWPNYNTVKYLLMLTTDNIYMYLDVEG